MSAQSLSEMTKTFKLPLLPGNTCGEELLRRNFRKTQLLSGTREMQVLRRGVTLPLDFDSTLVQRNTQLTATDAPEDDADTLARKVLRFYGYFTEGVQESSLEKERVRHVTLCYFLEDDTVSVSEPRQDNSGIPQQGAMVKRHRVPLPDGTGFLRFDQLAVGATISFYGRTYHLVDCDAFTREFMRGLGVEMPDALGYPQDTYMTMRSKAKERPVGMESMSTTINASGMKVKLSFNEIRATKQFLANDRKVLRFGAMWDDRRALYGSKHFFTLYYFLSDDTIEVVEKSETNSGRDPFPSFVRRQRMTKPRAGSQGRFENSATLSFKGKEEKAEVTYTDADLRMGATVWVFGRPLLIHSYDKFTQDYLREKFGVTEYTPIDVSEPTAAPVKRIPPPYNGFGDEEDSLGSWYSLEPKPPRKDETKFAQFGNNVVKFALKLENNIPTDEIRRFVLSCFLADDSICIFEPVQRNSGIVGGKFLQRQKLTNPQTGRPFLATDFFVGCHTNINGYPFLVYASDERSLSYMTQNSASFPMCDINRIVSKLQAMLMSVETGLADAFRRADEDGSGRLELKETAEMLRGLGLDVTDQEVLTVLRYFDRNGDASISYEEFAARIMPEGAVVGRDPRPWTEIFAEAQQLTDDTVAVKDRVEEQRTRVLNTTAAYAARAFLEAYAVRRALFHSAFRFACDFATDSKIGAKEFRTVVREKLNLPLDDTQINALCERCFPPGCRRVDYEEFLRLLNGTSNLNHNMLQLRDRR